MTFISYGQNLEDVILWRALRSIEAGFYIDVGAWDPHLDSVTLAFYKRGWHGINVEPNAEKYRALAEARPNDVNLDCAVSDQPGIHRFYEVPDTGLSTMDREIAQRHCEAGHTVVERNVVVTTLADICERHAADVVHFLKVDVEGLEAEVLASADFVRFRPWILVVEATEPNSTTSSHMRWEPILTEAGYELIYLDGLNRYYVAQEQAAALAPSLTMPPNVFDDYVSDADVRKAVENQAAGIPIPALQGMVAEQQETEAHVAAALAERDGLTARTTAMGDELQRLEQVLRDSHAAREAAERQALAARRDAELAYADAARILADAAGTKSVYGRAKTVAPAEMEPPVEGRQRVYYDASLIVRFGLETPVGLIRTEHYVAEFLARKTSIDLCFVIFDVETKSYRTLTRLEAKLLRNILFHRYDRDTAAPDIAWDEAADPDPDAEEGLQLAHVPDLDMLMVESDLLSGEPFTARLLLRRLHTATRLKPHDYDTMLVRYAMQLLPIRHRHSPIRRLTTRAVRWMGLHTGRALHKMVYAARTLLRRLSNVGRYVTRPDLHGSEVTKPPPERLPAAELFDAAAKPGSPAPTDIDDPEPAPAMFRFPRGSVLLSLANSWDYLDYRYLHRACKHDGLRFISIIYDVIGMELPFSTPSPPHIYHRHWVEIGHCAEALLAISKFSADQYNKYISKPNDLSPRLSHAPLPSFLRERSAEIGATPIASLAGRSFVVFCSTIETRKNHQLLLHLWDRLREVFGPEQLPILVFVGKWGWGTETVRLLSERNYRLRGHLQILDRVSDAELIWLYRNARFTVFPALSEGYGLAAAESLSFSTPVVVATCPALIEATEGLMPALDPLDIVGWFNELQALIRDDRRLEALRDAAARYRGPDYATFAETICQLALAAEPALQAVS